MHFDVYCDKSQPRHQRHYNVCPVHSPRVGCSPGGCAVHGPVRHGEVQLGHDVPGRQVRAEGAGDEVHAVHGGEAVHAGQGLVLQRRDVRVRVQPRARAVPCEPVRHREVRARIRVPGVVLRRMQPHLREGEGGRLRRRAVRGQHAVRGGQADGRGQVRGAAPCGPPAAHALHGRRRVLEGRVLQAAGRRQRHLAVPRDEGVREACRSGCDVRRPHAAVPDGRVPDGSEVPHGRQARDRGRPGQVRGGRCCEAAHDGRVHAVHRRAAVHQACGNVLQREGVQVRTVPAGEVPCEPVRHREVRARIRVPCVVLRRMPPRVREGEGGRLRRRAVRGQHAVRGGQADGRGQVRGAAPCGPPAAHALHGRRRVLEGRVLQAAGRRQRHLAVPRDEGVREACRSGCDVRRPHAAVPDGRVPDGSEVPHGRQARDRGRPGQVRGGRCCEAAHDGRVHAVHRRAAVHQACGNVLQREGVQVRTVPAGEVPCEPVRHREVRARIRVPCVVLRRMPPRVREGEGGRLRRRAVRGQHEVRGGQADGRGQVRGHRGDRPVRHGEVQLGHDVPGRQVRAEGADDEVHAVHGGEAVHAGQAGATTPRRASASSAARPRSALGAPPWRASPR